MRIIALEEHIATPLFREKLNAPPRNATLLRRAQEHGHDVNAELMDIGNSRLAHMNEVGIDVQVLSLTQPGPQAFPADVAIAVARDANDRMHEAIKRHPTRFAGFAALATADPNEAAKELERCITKLGFKGTMINGHAQGSYLDDKKYWGIFECAEALDVPVYLHPREPHPAVLKAYFEGFEEMQTAAWGFAMETCTHFLRLVFAGVFDAYPRLKFILGHMGEGLPFWLTRFEDHTRFAMQARGLKRTPRQYLTENLVITCSGNFSTAAMLCAVMEMGIDNVLFSVDWPYESNKVGVEFLKRLPLSDADKAKFAHANAERVLKL
ncbi:MAG TPA: amidohydrolase family protein [Stellaceae bacterium]|nr:amidohydrolase family protein [Stellaceae bacterium]